MRGVKPNVSKVVPMKDGIQRPAPDAPEWMTELGRQVWDELAPDMMRFKRLEPHFQYQFASYCESVSAFIGATNELAMSGIWYEVKTRNGLQQKKVAAWGIQQEAANAMRRDAALFGLSPVDEARLSGGGQGDLFDDLINELKGKGRASA